MVFSTTLRSMDSEIKDEGTAAVGECGSTAVAMLRDYIRLDTTNPPGNETCAVEFLARILSAAGIPFKVLSRDPARPNLVARLAGNGSNRPLILLHHTDVVPAGDGWTVPPFAGALKDGSIWGRGALDCKSLGIMHLLAMIRLKESGAQILRDVIFTAVCDEERGGGCGAGWLLESHSGLFKAEYLLGEGGLGLTAPGRPGIWLPSYAEKGILWLRLSARSHGGHGSVPKPGGAVERIAGAISRISSMENKVFITEEAKSNLASFSRRLGPPWSIMLRRPGSPLARMLVRRGAKKNHLVRSLMCSTVAVTSITAGTGENQLPDLCEATLDCRVHPSDSSQALMRRIEAAISDPAVTVQKTLDAPPTKSGVKTGLFDAMAAALQRNSTAKLVVPMLSPATTDSRFFRKNGVTCYGIVPILAGMEDMEPHRVDERISVANLEMGCSIMLEIVRDICAG
jgi:acetylornithine deacetylase/succinyl-diaminopimelate desuccinylase-like protein